MEVELFDLQPTLKGNFVELRPLELSDFPALFEAACDPVIWEQHNETDRYQLHVFQKFFDRAMGCRGALAIVDLKSRSIIGSSSYCDYDKAGKSVSA